MDLVVKLILILIAGVLVTVSVLKNRDINEK